jgi:hypothetical protein
MKCPFCAKEIEERWLSDYPGRTLPATKSGCR